MQTDFANYTESPSIEYLQRRADYAMKVSEYNENPLVISAQKRSVELPIPVNITPVWNWEEWKWMYPK